MRWGLHEVSEAVPVVDDLVPTRIVSVLLRAALVALTTPPLRFSLQQNQRMVQQE
jgi:hypothetical protein